MSDIYTLATGEVLKEFSGYITSQWKLTDYNGLFNTVQDRGQSTCVYNFPPGTGFGQINQIFYHSGTLSGNKTFDLRSATGTIMGLNDVGVFNRVKYFILENQGTQDINVIAVSGGNFLANGIYGKPNIIPVRPSSVLYHMDGNGYEITTTGNRYILINASSPYNVNYKLVVMGNE